VEWGLNRDKRSRKDLRKCSHRLYALVIKQHWEVSSLVTFSCWLSPIVYTMSANYWLVEVNGLLMVASLSSYSAFKVNSDCYSILNLRLD